MAAEERFSAMNIACPWRGLNVVPSAINQAERQAVMFMYSGILATVGTAPSRYVIAAPFHLWLPIHMKKQRNKA